MIEIIKELNIEVTKQNIFQALIAKQYDMNTRFLKVTLTDSGTPINIPNTDTAKAIINAERKDGQSKGFEGVINDDGTVTVPLHSWMLELDGTVICDISVIDIAADNNKKLTTTSFTLIVEKAAYGGDIITSEPQYDVLVSLLEAVPTAQEALKISNQALAKSNQANSKYDACVEATNNANAVRAEIEAGGYIESLKELNEGGKFSFWVGTQQEYNSLETILPNCLCIITDDPTVDNIQNSMESLLNEIEKNRKQIAENLETINALQGHLEWMRNRNYKEILKESPIDVEMTDRSMIDIIDYQYNMLRVKVYFSSVDSQTGTTSKGYSLEFYVNLVSNLDMWTYNGENGDFTLSVWVSKIGNLRRFNIRNDNMSGYDFEINNVTIHGLC